jgi:hypothetical protein
MSPWHHRQLDRLELRPLGPSASCRNAADLALFALVGNALMCYRCGAQYRGTAEMDAHGQFNLETHEKYRQLAARVGSTAPGRP